MTDVNRIIGGALIVSGTCIGAGMLALPVATAPTGFYCSIILLVAAWFFMYVTGLYVLEVNLALASGSSFVSMARQTLGKLAGFLTWLIFLLLLYSLLAAYVSAGGDLLQDIIIRNVSDDLPSWTGALLWTLVFSVLVYTGVTFSDYINRLLMLGLCVTYAFLSLMGSAKINTHYFLSGDYRYLFAALPILFTSFGYQIIVPSMREYLGGDIKGLKRVLLIGSFLPLLIYVFWEAIIFGAIPSHGVNSLTSILQSGHAPTRLIEVLQNLLDSPWITMAARSFVFFAVASSFLGVSIGLFDFISDSYQIQKDNRQRFFVLALTFIPPLMYVWFYPEGFISALTYAGLFVAISHGLLPALMAFSLRRGLLTGGSYRVFGGMTLLAVTILFFIMVIVCDIAANLHWVETIPKI